MLARIFLAITLAATPAALLAHHGWSAYDDTRTLTVKAPLASVSWGNPHGAAKVQWQKRSWDVVLAPPTRTSASGLKEGIIPLGATVTAHGHRHLTPTKYEVKTERLTWGNRVFNVYPDRD